MPGAPTQSGQVIVRWYFHTQFGIVNCSSCIKLFGINAVIEFTCVDVNYPDIKLFYCMKNFIVR